MASTSVMIVHFQAVVRRLGDNEVMVILDNHVSKPGWCCGNTDGNGFFGDEYFDPDQWVRGLTEMATMFRGVPNVVGMSLRNELRGPRQNVPDWYRYEVPPRYYHHAIINSNYHFGLFNLCSCVFFV